MKEVKEESEGRVRMERSEGRARSEERKRRKGENGKK
jgi:hypothetical protein